MIASAAGRPSGSRHRTVLIGGDLRFLGGPLVARLAATAESRPGHRLDVLTLGSHRIRDAAGPVTSHWADAGAARFGMPAAEYRSLVERVDAVVIIGAICPFGARRREDARRSRRMLDFADAAGAQVYRIRSAFDLAPGRDAVAGAGAVTASAAASEGADIVVSAVIGDSRTGAIGATPRIYRALSALLGRAGSGWPTVDPERHLDLIPCDVVADVVAGLVAHRVAGGEVWVTMGERALTVRQVVDRLVEAAPDRGLRTAPMAGAAGSWSADRERIDDRLVSVLVDRVLRPEPLESSLGDRFAQSISELGAIGVRPLPDAIRALDVSMRGRRLDAAGYAATAANAVGF